MQILTFQMVDSKAQMANNLLHDVWKFCSIAQPYVPKEPPTVRVVEGPLFSEVVAYYQHFQQMVRIHNVPGNHTHNVHPTCMHIPAFFNVFLHVSCTPQV